MTLEESKSRTWDGGTDMATMKYFDTKVLDEILDKMINTVGKSKEEIFKIGEQSRKDFNSTVEELNKIKQTVKNIIEEEEQLEKEVRKARKRLSEVSLYFNLYTEEQVRVAYETAHNLQLKLTMIRQMEKQLRERRDELERRLNGLKETIDRADQLVTQTTVVLHYLTGDLKHVAELFRDAKEKQEFGLKIIEAQEEERRRLSREIHDGPAQMLANVMMRADLVEKVIQKDGIEAAIQDIRQLKKIVRDALYEVRYIIYDLRPMALDDLGIVPTLKKYLSTIEEYNQGCRILFKFIGKERRLESKMEVALFRLVQESVQNALKHSGAKKIEVKLEINDQKVIAMVKDDGCGFDPHKKKDGSFGIRGMKERVELLDGELMISSAPGKGTTVLITLPL